MAVWRSAIVSIVVCMAVLMLPQQVRAQALAITEVRGLNMGDCDNIGGNNYVVAAAEAVGPAACPGAQSGRFEVTGTPNARVKVDLPGTTFTVSQGAAILTLTKATADPSKGNIRLSATGTLTIWVGAELRVPPGGISPAGVYTGSSILTVNYK